MINSILWSQGIKRVIGQPKDSIGFRGLRDGFKCEFDARRPFITNKARNLSFASLCMGATMFLKGKEDFFGDRLIGDDAEFHNTVSSLLHGLFNGRTQQVGLGPSHVHQLVSANLSYGKLHLSVKLIYIDLWKSLPSVLFNASMLSHLLCVEFNDYYSLLLARPCSVEIISTKAEIGPGVIDGDYVAACDTSIDSGHYQTPTPDEMYMRKRDLMTYLTRASERDGEYEWWKGEYD